MPTHETLTIFDLMKATPLDEPDRASIKWRKRRYYLPKRHAETRTAVKRPQRRVYYKILEKREDDCQSVKYVIQITMDHSL